MPCDVAPVTEGAGENWYANPSMRPLLNVELSRRYTGTQFDTDAAEVVGGSIDTSTTKIGRPVALPPARV